MRTAKRAYKLLPTDSALSAMRSTGLACVGVLLSIVSAIADLAFHEILDDRDDAARQQPVERVDELVDMLALADQRRLQPDDVAVVLREGDEHAVVAQQQRADEARQRALELVVEHADDRAQHHRHGLAE